MQLPRSFIILLSILIAATFLVGTLLTYASAQAADFPLLGSTPTLPSISLLPPPANDAPSMQTPSPTLTPTASPISTTVYADTTGIIALGILMVVVVLIGIIWGERSLLKKKEPIKK
jgi:hypothetical protein